MSLKNFVSKMEPAMKLGGWLYWILGLVVGAAVWLAGLQIAVAANAAAVKELKEQVRPIDVIRQDVRWIKKRLGGPDGD